MTDSEGGSDVIATYREIAAQFRLKGPDQGRTKAKRAGWPILPHLQNHPSDPIRVSVPREAWEAASQLRERLGPRVHGASPSRIAEPSTSQTAEIRHLLVVVEGALGSLKDQLERERERVREAVERAEQLAVLAATLRVHVATSEGERNLARLEGDTLRERMTEAETARHDAEARAKAAELDAEEARRLVEATQARVLELEQRPTQTVDQAAITFAEEAARQAQERADEADRRAAVATNRLERFQQERIAQAQAATARASEASEIAKLEAAGRQPWWRWWVRRQ